MIIPPDALSEAALTGVIEEFVTRDGTDLTEVAAKAATVRKALQAGHLVIAFDPEEETCNILPREEVPPEDTAS